MDLNILYEDDDIIFINKESGIVCMQALEIIVELC